VRFMLGSHPAGVVMIICRDAARVMRPLCGRGGIVEVKVHDGGRLSGGHGWPASTRRGASSAGFTADVTLREQLVDTGAKLVAAIG
jgi:hypothetical protein